MAKYVKNPVVVDAVRFNNGQFSETPGWLAEALVSKVIRSQKFEEHAPEEFFIKTLEGMMRVSDGDYIIKGIKGELYPCKPDIFEATYTFCI